MAEIWCDVHSTLIIADLDTDPGCPIYVPPCETCLKEAIREGREQAFEALRICNSIQGGKK